MAIAKKQTHWLLISTLIATAMLSAAYARGRYDSAPPAAGTAGMAAVIRYPLVAESSADTRVQGSVFARSHGWMCVSRRCRSYVVTRHVLPELCAALVAEVGPLRYFRAGDLRFPATALEECNRMGKDASLSSPVQASSRFSFVRENDRYWLVRAGQPRLAVPSDWILSSDEAAQESDSYVSTADFDKQVQEFPLGGGLIGLHVSSYAISGEGSVLAAAGRDVFLVFDPTQEKLADGEIRLGVSKARGRVSGTWNASFQRFYLQDVNADERMDIGVLEEQAGCAGRSEPTIKAGAMRWFVFDDGRWAHDRQYDGATPRSSRASELPLMGMTKSPTVYVLERCDRSNRSQHVDRAP